MINVLVCREGSTWVAQALDPDLAAQASDSMLGAVAELGVMFDARDQVALSLQQVAPLEAAPLAYAVSWNDGDNVGLVPLGRRRLARVHVGVSPFAEVRR